VTPRKGAYTSLPLDYRSKQENNVLVIQHECAASHIIAGEKLGDFLLKCDWLSRHNQSPSAAPILLSLTPDRWRIRIFDFNPMRRRITVLNHKKEGRPFSGPKRRKRTAHDDGAVKSKAINSRKAQ
jgi:hypothetical protein